MTTIQPFSVLDLLEYNYINLDILTETFSVGFYGKYISMWPDCCISMLNNSGTIFGYLIGKVEGERYNEQKKDWHGHISAVTVAPKARRQGIARYLMDYIEDISSNKYNAWFVDLFVRSKNPIAIKMYRNLGYELYREVNKYYSKSEKEAAENAHDMRKSLPRDAEKATMKPTGKIIEPHELEYH